MKACAVIPSRNHYRCVPAIVERLRREKLFVYIVDDGSLEPARSALAALHDPQNGVAVRRFEHSRGKGAAVIAAMQAAIDDGFSHALQIDADGQHDLAALPRFLALAARYPEAAICGKPLYDASAPMGRRIGRWLTHVWVWIETLSFAIADSMCGFRLYPLKPCAPLLAEEPPGPGMEFDTEILVRLFWRGVATVWVDVQVQYPDGNISNFNMLRDNWRITKMHTRLFFTMLLRLPRILRHRPPKIASPKSWSGLKERGMYTGLKLSAALCRRAGRRGQRLLIAPVVLYFYLTGGKARRASRTYLTRVLGRSPHFRERWRHFMNFGMRALDVFLAWTGYLPANALKPGDETVLAEIVREGRGCLLVVSHLGNVEAVRALVDETVRARLTVLVHTRHAANYNRLMGESADAFADNLIQVTEVGPETVIALKERLAAGGIVVIAGDRTAVLSHGREVKADFFGKPAPFPEGPWVLGALLGCPVYLMHCLAEDGRYALSVERFAERIDLPREARAAAIAGHIARYAAALERTCARAPFQWYNFYDFWAET